MPYKLEVGAIRGCILGSAELDRLTLVAGYNHVGKTSFLQGVAAAMTGDALIYPKLTKKDAKDLIHCDHNMGMATVTGPDGGYMSISYPTLTPESKGIPPVASRVAMNLDSVITMTDKDRYAFLTKLLNSSPTNEQFAEAVSGAKLTPEMMEQVWAKITTYGWDATHKDTQGRGSELKGAWQQVTGEQKWGSQKGETWLPVVWGADLISARVEDLEKAVHEAQEWVIAASKQEAIDTAERERLQETVRGENEHRTWYKAASEKHRKTTRDVEDARRERDKYRPSPDGLECPFCKEPIIYAGGKLLAYTKEAAQAATKEAALHESTLALIKELESRQEGELKECEQVAAKLRDIEAAKKQLAALEPTKTEAEKTGIALEDAQARLAAATERLEAFKAKQEADKLHRNIMRNNILVDALAPDGVRQTVLQTALTAANGELVGISAHAGWPAVQITPDIDLTYGGRRVFLLSDSEQLRARIILQIFVARRESAPFILIDRADMLVTNQERSNLFKVVLKSGIPAIIAMSLHSRDELPPRMPDGCRMYWMEAGTMEAVS
jgi:hypothetical protein